MTSSEIGETFFIVRTQVAFGRARPRVHWCPSGDFAFLPLHAAGIYLGRNKICTSDFMVSSYTPSLSALVKSQAGFEPIPRHDLNALVVSATSAHGLRSLHNAKDEALMVESLLRGARATTNNVSSSSEPGAQDVFDTLPTTHILHLACHGKQESDPLESHFSLHDGPLSIATLMKLDLSRAVFAFLSACETAKGDRNQPDQTVHLAASLMFCGFRSVIGTMW